MLNKRHSDRDQARPSRMQTLSWGLRIINCTQPKCYEGALLKAILKYPFELLIVLFYKKKSIKKCIQLPLNT